MQEVVTGLSGKPDKLYAEGLHIAGERYVLTKAEDRSLYARKVGLYHMSAALLPLQYQSCGEPHDWFLWNKQGREGVVIVKTTQAILIAHYADGMIAGNAATTVEQLADYLISTGY
jgi:profilin